MASVVVPTVTAFEQHSYRAQIEGVAGFASRVHVDLMDGVFTKSLSPSLKHVWWPHHMQADIHLMYQKPGDYVDQLIKLSPSLVIIHAEADVDHMLFSAELHKHDIKTGLAILQKTKVDQAERVLHSFDHALVFSGDLGYHGGTADLSLLEKVKDIRKHHPEVEISWDGGINDQNAKKLVDAGVDVLNVGGFIQKSELPKDAYVKLMNSIEKSLG